MHRSAQGPRIFSGWLLILGGLAILGAGCSSHIIASHEPMHSLGGYVTLKASATGLVDRIEFRVQRFAVDSTDLNSTETELSPVLFVWACDPAFAKKSLTCSHQMAFSGDGQMIEFHARAVFWNGSKDDEIYRFASGDFPVADAPIPIRMNLGLEEAIDVVIVPHPEILAASSSNSLASFRKHLDDLIDGILFDYAAVLDNRGLYNFWYSPGTGTFDTSTCVFDDPEDVELELFADALMYVHLQEMRDCANGKRFSTEMWYDKSVLHEFGHALLGLRDEYRVSSSEYGPQSDMPNIFLGREACVNYAPEVGLPGDYCKSATPAFNFWRIDPTGADGCIMGDSQHYAWSDFGPACMRRINWRHDMCLAGECFVLGDQEGGEVRDQ